MAARRPRRRWRSGRSAGSPRGPAPESAPKSLRVPAVEVDRHAPPGRRRRSRRPGTAPGRLDRELAVAILDATLDQRRVAREARRPGARRRARSCFELGAFGRAPTSCRARARGRPPCPRRGSRSARGARSRCGRASRTTRRRRTTPGTVASASRLNITVRNGMKQARIRSSSSNTSRSKAGVAGRGGRRASSWNRVAR